MLQLHDWLTEKLEENTFFYIKRLSANDTGATGGHQVGIYIPASVTRNLFPSIDHHNTLNPDIFFPANVQSHQCAPTTVRATYYNSRFFGKTRNETRITRWGVKSPIQDRENTGALTALAFTCSPGNDCTSVDIWVCKDVTEEDCIESSVGNVVPGTLIYGPATEIFGGLLVNQQVAPRKINFPDQWHENFPTGKEIIEFTKAHFNTPATDPDNKLIQRRNNEFSIFLQIEELHVLEIIQRGFKSVDEFIALANSVSNRRKSRAGKSLELHLESLFLEFGLSHFTTQAITEGNKKPDFIFPSAKAYHDPSYPEHNLRMLAVKTTCKDRWRQILNEANRIKSIHLFTLQEGVSEAQFREMQSEGVTLVVPSTLHTKYPKEIRDHLMNLSDFIEELIQLYKTHPTS